VVTEALINQSVSIKIFPKEKNKSFFEGAFVLSEAEVFMASSLCHFPIFTGMLHTIGEH
jgi:hypothetical protein